MKRDFKEDKVIITLDEDDLTSYYDAIKKMYLDNDVDAMLIGEEFYTSNYSVGNYIYFNGDYSTMCIFDSFDYENLIEDGKIELKILDEETIKEIVEDFEKDL